YTVAMPVHGRRQRLERAPLVGWNHGVDVERQPGAEELLPRGDARELRAEPGRDLLRGRGGEPATRAAPVEPQALERPAQRSLVGVRRLTGEQGLHQSRPRGVAELHGKRRGQGLDIALE